VIRKLEHLAADRQPVSIVEGDGRQGTIRIVVSRQQPARFPLRDDDRVAAKGLRSADVVGVGVIACAAFVMGSERGPSAPSLRQRMRYCVGGRP
jgi:hypothetical protein